MRVHSLTARLLITVLLASAVPFVVFGWFVRGGMRDRLEGETVRVLLEDQVEMCAERLDALLEVVYRDSSLIGSAADRLLAGGPVDDFDFVLDLLPGFSNDFQAVVVADRTGQVRRVRESVALDPSTRGSRSALPARQRVDDQDWFLDLVERDQPIVWLGRHMSPFLHRNPERDTRNPSDYSLGLAFQIIPFDSEDGGVALLLASWSRFQDVLYRLAVRLRDDAGLPGAQVFLTDADGRVLAGTETERYNRPVGPPRLLEAVRTIRDESVVVSYRAAEPRFAAVAPVTGEAYRRQDWRCVVAVPDEELFRTSREFAAVLLLVTVAVVGVLLVWAILASRAILRPVLDVAAATARIAAGDLEARVPVRGRDELADLAESFNAMTADLAESRRVLRDAERQAAWGEMARQIAHEIKNPLTPMRVSAQLLQRAIATGDPRVEELARRTVRTVLAQTEQLARIASDFRHFAGQPVRRVERVGVDDLLRDVAEDFAALDGSDGVTVAVRPAAGDAVVDVDRTELRRVFLNLVQNAIEAVGDRGRIELASRVDGDQAVWTVRDDGPGIPPEVRARLFEPYFTTRSAGTGLGLAICRRVAEQHGGGIELVDVEPGRTTFAIRLPLARGDAPAMTVVG